MQDCLIDWGGRIKRAAKRGLGLSSDEKRLPSLADPEVADRFAAAVVDQWGGIDTRQGYERWVPREEL